MVSRRLTATLALVLAIVAFTTYDGIRFRRGIEDELRKTAELIAASAQAAIAFDDRTTAEESLAILANDIRVVGAAITLPPIWH